MSALSLGLTVGIGLSSGCGDRYGGPAEDLPVPRAKKLKPAPDVKPAGPVEPDTCKYNFDGSPGSLVSKGKHDSAKGMAQDADNTLSGWDNATWQDRRNKVLAAVSTLTDALKADPYSPLATYEMAAAYAIGGKKKCMIACLTRLR